MFFSTLYGFSNSLVFGYIIYFKVRRGAPGRASQSGPTERDTQDKADAHEVEAEAQEQAQAQGDAPPVDRQQSESVAVEMENE